MMQWIFPFFFFKPGTPEKMALWPDAFFSHGRMTHRPQLSLCYVTKCKENLAQWHFQSTRYLDVNIESTKAE